MSTIKKDFETIFDLVMETERQEWKNKYEEAAKEYADRDGLSMHIKTNAINSFLAGAEHGSKEAHNEAIEKVLEICRKANINHGAVSLHVVTELEKLKL